MTKLARESKAKLSESMKKWHKEHPEARKNISESMKKWHKEHPEHKFKTSKSIKEYYEEYWKTHVKKSKKRMTREEYRAYMKTQEYKDKMSKSCSNKSFHQDPEYRRKLSEAAKYSPRSHKKRQHHTKETKLKMSNTRKERNIGHSVWNNKNLKEKSKWVCKLLKNNPRLISETEKFFRKFLNKNFKKIGFKYVGDGELVLGGKCPDFLWLGKNKRLIELVRQNLPKHKEREIIFKEYGYKTLFVNYNHFKKNSEIILKQIKDFIPLRKKII